MTKEELIDILKATGVFTGSRAFGVATENSDWDYLVRPYSNTELIYDQEDLIDKFVNTEEYGDLSNVCYIVDPRNGRRYNFIWHEHQKEQNAWIKTTKEMKKVPKEKIRNKKDRIDMFEEFCVKFRKEENKSKETFKEKATAELKELMLELYAAKKAVKNIEKKIADKKVELQEELSDCSE